jgi:hypothetical protein
MPLHKIQTDILRLLASHRDPDSYVAGASASNRDAPRYSGDIDVFHGREERAAAATDAQTLEQAGYGVRWVRREPAVYTAEVTGPTGATEAFVAHMPTEKIGLLFLQAGKVVQPDPPALKLIRRMPGNRGTNGPPAPTLHPPCWNVTTRSLAATSQNRNAHRVSKSVHFASCATLRKGYELWKNRAFRRLFG